MQKKILFIRIISFILVAIIFGSLGSTQTFAKTKTEECIAKTMPWDDISKCAPKTIAKVPQAVISSSSSVPSGSLSPDVLFDMINARRSEIGLPAYQKDDRVCQLAQERGPELAGEMSSGNLHAGFYGRNWPYWGSENMISLGSEQAAFNWWMNSALHRRAIENPNYTHSCGVCYGRNCAQIFTAFQPK